MSYWEEKYIWKNNPFGKHLVYYGRYIDIIIWEGTVEDIHKFVNYYNQNPYNVWFTFVTDPNDLVFLDLSLSWDVDGNTISKTHFKETAGNSYLHMSGHLSNRKDNIPYSQFHRLSRNCANVFRL